MHELKIIQDIFPLIEKVASDNQLKVIHKVTLGVGKLRQIQSDFLKFAFTTVAKDTIADQAELIIKSIPITVFCESCKKQFKIEDNIYICPECQGVSIEILTGKEIILESIDGVKGSSPTTDSE